MNPTAEAPGDPQNLPQAILEWQPRYHRHAPSALSPLGVAGLVGLAAFLAALAIGILIAQELDD